MNSLVQDVDQAPNMTANVIVAVSEKVVETPRRVILFLKILDVQGF